MEIVITPHALLTVHTEFVYLKEFDKITSKKKFSLFPNRSHAVLHEDADAVVPEINKWLEEIYHMSFQHQLNP